MTDFIDQGWRSALETLITSAKKSLVIVTPYIKSDEAAWVRELLDDNVHVETLCSIQVDAISAGSLDIEALIHLSTATSGSLLFHNERLHAKVYIADDSAAIVTSGNLTQSGLDSNLEFGVLVDDPTRVQEVQAHMTDYRQRSSPVSPDSLPELLRLQIKLREEKELLEDGIDSTTRELFDDLLAEAQIPADESGKIKREDNSVFRGAVLTILAIGDMGPKDIADRIQVMYPELCDDSESRYSYGNGSKWRSRVRHARDNLKRKGRITYNPRTELWSLVGTTQQATNAGP